MENKNYKVDRDEIYTGKVYKTKKENISTYEEGLYDISLCSEDEIREHFDSCRFLLEKKFQIVHNKGENLFYRNMLFTLDENKHANDLLYNSPHYPIFNISTNEDCINSSICLVDSAFRGGGRIDNIGYLLKYLGYSKELSYEDIIRIYNLLFKTDFILDNCNSFGVLETDSHDSCLEIFDLKGNHRTFNGIIENNEIPRCYFMAISEYKSCFLNGKVTNHFIPPEYEENVFKLK